MIKVICTDVDGTLLNKLREVDEVTRNVFSLLEDNIRVVLASSRMPKALYHLQEPLSIRNAPLICYNGGLVLSGGKKFTEDQILITFTIPELIISKIVLLANKLDLHYSIYHNDTWVANRVDSWTDREVNNTRVSPDRILGNNFTNSGLECVKEAHKIMLMGEPERIDEIEKILDEDASVALCRSKNTYLEITPVSTNKSLALKLLVERSKEMNGVSVDEIMAFGDNHNDFELLRDVKYGIAVANAIDELKAVAHAITESNVEHGVAKYIKNFGGLCKN